MKYVCGVLLCAVAANAQPTLVGNWLGTLDAGAAKLTLAFHVTQNERGEMTATLDSLDQNLKGAPVKEVAMQGDRVRFDIAGLRAVYEAQITADGSALSGTFTQLRALPLRMRKVDKVEAQARPQEPKAPFPYRSEDVFYQSRGSAVAGTLTIPSGEGRFPAVILISGSGPQDRDGTFASHKPFLVIADSLTRRGIAVLRVDDRGAGKSAGEPSALTIEQISDDVLQALEFLKNDPRLDARRIGVIGHGEGAIVGSLAAVRSKDVSFVVMLAGVGVPGDEALAMQAETLARAAGVREDAIAQNRAVQSVVFKVLRADSDPRTAVYKLTNEYQAMRTGLSAAQRTALDLAGIEATLERRFAAVSAPEIRSIVLSNSAEILRRVTVPTLALHGAQDSQLSAAQNLPGIATALAVGGNTNFSVATLPGLNHMFQTCGTCLPNEYGELEETFSPTALAIMGDWIVRQSLPR
ncbi:MAG: alpha/beta hydrolase [Bryobacteraceae bacterium]